MSRILSVVAVALFLWAAIAWWTTPKVNAVALLKREPELPQSPFKQPEEAYAALGTGGFAVHRKPATVQLPNLSDELMFYGINQRPDASREAPVVHLAIRGTGEVVSAPVSERRYLLFDREESKYQFSPENGETSLWVTPSQPKDEGEIQFAVGLRMHDGTVVSEPQEHAAFTLKLAPYSAHQRMSWTLGDLRVDNSLLARQRCRWFGQDLFYARHGGETFALARGRERIDFGEEAEGYSCFIALGESLIWKDERWCNAEEGEETTAYPLLTLRKLDERLMVFDLWDAEGRGKIALSLMKSRGGWGATGMRNALRFVAAKTWSQFVLECGAQRVDVAPGDWLLFIEAGLHKLETVEEIDAFVSGELEGELMVIEGLGRHEGKGMLLAQIYNRTRSEMEERQIPLSSHTSSPPPPPPPMEPTPKDGYTLADLPDLVHGLVKEGVE